MCSLMFSVVFFMVHLSPLQFKAQVKELLQDVITYYLTAIQGMLITGQNRRRLVDPKTEKNMNKPIMTFHCLVFEVKEGHQRALG